MKEFDINKIQLKIQSPDFKTDETIKSDIQTNVEKLGKIFSGITLCDVVMKTDNDSRLNTVKVEIKLHVPGNMLFSSVKDEKKEHALKLAFEEVQNQLRHYKEKLQDKHEKVSHHDL